MNDQQIQNILQGIAENLATMDRDQVALEDAEVESNNTYLANTQLFNDVLARQANGEDVTKEIARISTNLFDLARERVDLFKKYSELQQRRILEQRRSDNILTMHEQIVRDQTNVNLAPNDTWRREKLESDKNSLAELLKRNEQIVTEEKSPTLQKLNEDLTHISDNPEDGKNLLNERLKNYKEEKAAQPEQTIAQPVKTDGQPEQTTAQPVKTDGQLQEERKKIKSQKENKGLVGRALGKIKAFCESHGNTIAMGVVATGALVALGFALVSGSILLSASGMTLGTAAEIAGVGYLAKKAKGK